MNHLPWKQRQVGGKEKETGKKNKRETNKGETLDAYM